MDDFSHALSKVHKDWFHLQDFSKALKILEVVESNGTAFAPSLDRVLSAYTLAPEQVDRKSTRLNSSHIPLSRMPSSA